MLGTAHSSGIRGGRGPHPLQTGGPLSLADKVGSLVLVLPALYLWDSSTLFCSFSVPCRAHSGHTAHFTQSAARVRLASSASGALRERGAANIPVWVHL